MLWLKLKCQIKKLLENNDEIKKKNIFKFGDLVSRWDKSV